MDLWKRLCPSHIAINKPSSTTRQYDQHNQRVFSQQCRLTRTKTEGEFVIAQQAIPEGTLILTEDPLVHQFHTTLIGVVCPGCLKSLKGIKHLTPCRQSSCTWELTYCSSVCESAHWFKVHAYVCAFFSMVKRDPSILLALQLWTLHVSLGLVDELDQHATTDLDHYHQGASFLTDLFRFSIHDTRTMRHDLIRYQGMIRCNGFGIQRRWTRTNNMTTVTMDTVATAIYPLASKFNHSCQPNVLALFMDDTSLQLRTLRPIRSGQPLYISYGPLAANTIKSKRQDFLQDHYFFRCGCQACQVVPDPRLPSSIDQVYLCPHCNYKRICINTPSCPQCHSLIDWVEIFKVEKAIDYYHGNWDKVLRLQQSIYHDETLAIGKTYDQLARVHHLSHRSKEAIHYCELSLSIVRSVYGEASPEAAEEMFKLCGLIATGEYDRTKARNWIRKTRDLYHLLGLNLQQKDDIEELDAMDRFI
ncbi:hypothetical protein BC941DRAFT_414075 [Chlamydoabsidia padenii]|nr:hypothetical protein BC941DRAFT_414075 [Chlamydoabsidia padenii]